MADGDQAAQTTSTAEGNKQVEQQSSEATGDKRFTQTELNSIVATAKREAVETAKRQATEEAQRKQAEEQGNFKLLLDKETAKVAQLEAEVTRLTAELNKSRVGAKYKLSPNQAARLRGTTEEELEADAKDLIKTFGISTDSEQKEASKTDKTADATARTPEGSKDTKVGDKQVDDHYAMLIGTGDYGM